MGKYMFEVSYTVEGVRGLLEKGGSTRKSVVQSMAKKLGGKLEAFYFAFGGTDVYALIDLPDNEAAAAAALTIGASGAANIRTVVLLTPEEIDAAGQQQVAYRPPGG
jgi:uncharacterized protein with GYD domain